MADNLTKEQRIITMRAVKSGNTKAEAAVRNLLDEFGIVDYSCHNNDISGKPDIAIKSARIVIFVDGCFWHGCPICNRPMPVTNQEYWENKIRRTMERDRNNTILLANLGWTVIRIWEHALKSDDERLQFVNLVSSAIKKSLFNG